MAISMMDNQHIENNQRRIVLFGRLTYQGKLANLCSDVTTYSEGVLLCVWG